MSVSMVAPSRMSQMVKPYSEMPSSLQMAPSDERSDVYQSNDFSWSTCPSSSENSKNFKAQSPEEPGQLTCSAAGVLSKDAEGTRKEATQPFESGSCTPNTEHGSSVIARVEFGSPSHGLMNEQRSFDYLVMDETRGSTGDAQHDSAADAQNSREPLHSMMTMPHLMEFPTSAKDASVAEGPSQLLQKWKSSGAEEKEGSSELVDEEEAAMLAEILKNAQKKKDTFMREREREEKEKAKQGQPSAGRSSSSSNARKNGVPRLEDTPVPSAPCWWKKPPSAPHSRPPVSPKQKPTQPAQPAATTNQKAPGGEAGGAPAPRVSSFMTAGPNPVPKPSPLPQIPKDPEAALRVLSKMGNRDPSKSL